MNEIESLEQAIQALETQRALLGDAVVEAGLAPMRERLQVLRRQGVEQQRKQVTILFADASGFTAASALQDPEEVTETMNALWQCVDGVILEYGGTIDKHIGDAVMAVWGMTTTSEDDAERAVRAALSMQQAVKEANLQLGGSPLQIRIG
ncbi:MAG TPA: adenylate/guanylate cyclase domain-containing protein, partial [Anaerolineaceae bacterium]|nr:adenylate/guanylate cyclase domain-containing protein [Anaerolineaceae bacterium]